MEGHMNMVPLYTCVPFVMVDEGGWCGVCRCGVVWLSVVVWWWCGGGVVLLRALAVHIVLVFFVPRSLLFSRSSLFSLFTLSLLFSL